MNNTYEDITDPNEVATIYRNTITGLNDYGWTAGSSLDPDGRRCLTAAINTTAGRNMIARSDDLLRPLVLWLLDNRTGDFMVAATRCMSLVQINQFVATRDVSETSMWRCLAQAWNDQRVDGSNIGRARKRTHAEVVSVLDAVAADIEVPA